MKFFWRMLAIWLRARRLPRRDARDVGRIRLRVLPTDCDVFLHMNNGVYLTVQDLGRLDWMLRTGVQPIMRRHGWNVVAARISISYRRSLDLGAEYDLETRLLGTDERNFYMEQRFVHDGQLAAQGYVIGRFLGADGPVPMAEIAAGMPEIDAWRDEVPAWVREWADAARLPSSRGDHPSIWRNR
ncbi:MAG: thioesterase [Microbacteriaceae bacterium]|mgnify:CR=1 FL=1|nr:thioesterase [Microbacteriaceae bacterium]